MRRKIDFGRSLVHISWLQGVHGPPVVMCDPHVYLVCYLCFECYDMVMKICDAFGTIFIMYGDETLLMIFSSILVDE